MQEVSFEEALEIITIKDPRYPREAYLFVREALDHTQRVLVKEKHLDGTRHVSGQELLAGIRDFARAQFGPMAMMVLEEWGIHSCQDFGELVFNMVETGGCPALALDDITDIQSFVARLQTGFDPLSAFLWQNLSEPCRKLITADASAPESRETLIQQLNALIASKPFYIEERFTGVALSTEVKCLLDRSLTGVPLAQFNRLLLESAYPKNIARSHGLLAKTNHDSRADFEDGYDFYEAFRRPFLPPSKQAPPQQPAPAPSHR
jgi:uncharacterized repeat protein (TIGR04138 family)